MRLRSKALFVACVAFSLLAGVQFLSASASASAQRQAVSERVIVVFKNQAPGTPASPAGLSQRRSSFAATQAPVLSQLSGSGAQNIHSYTLLDAVSATVSPAEVDKLKSTSSVSRVVPDQIIRLAPTRTPGQAATAPGSTPLPGACAPPGKVQLNPQALQTINAASDVRGAKTARSLGLTGAGVTVGFIADGLDINNQDFIRANGQRVFRDFKDFTGQGTNVPTGGGEAFLDASSIAAQGRHIYDISHYSALPLNRPCNIRIEGVAPGASLVALDVFGAENAGYNSQFLQAIDYAVTVDHVNVLNESLGSNFFPDDQASLDLIKQANDDAVAAGTTVTASSGDAGVTSTIGTPATDPLVLAVGASTTYRTDAQTGYAGGHFPGVTGWLNNNISSLSSGGFEQNGRTVDLAAPGELNWTLCTPDLARWSDCTSYAGQPSPVHVSGGTSESAPLTAGEAALVIQAYRLKHGGATPTPALVKQLIVSTTTDIGSPADQQGAGLADAYKAVLAAEAYHSASGSTDKQTGVLIARQTQLNATAAPGAPLHLTDTLTNESGSRQTVLLSTRQIGAYQSLLTATVTLSDASSPKLIDFQGITDNYQILKFTVPTGQNRLNASIAFQNASSSLAARVRLTLIDPNGNLAAYSLPQGDGNYGNAQVTDPAAGTWTAYIYSRDSKDGGTQGQVLFGASSARYARFGTVSPSKLTLGPGQSGTVALDVPTPGRPGDTSGSVVVRSTPGGAASATTTTIPVTRRSLIPSGNQSFADTLTGGNGRAFFTGQTAYYQLDLARAQPELNATVTLADNANNPFSAWLINPAGEAVAFASNTASSPTGLTNLIGAQLHALSAPAGRWTLAVDFAPAVSGTALQESFRVTTNQLPIPAGGGGLPGSYTTKLTAGQTYKYDVTIRNRGTAPESFFPDARFATSAVYPLAALNGNTTQEPYTSSSNFQGYLVPTQTSQLRGAAATNGSAPIVFDMGTYTGDPDVASTYGYSASAAVAGDPVAQGVWGLNPTEYGAFGVNGGPSETVTTAMNVRTRGFDRSFGSASGDLWLASFDPALLKSFSPVTAGPGQTATIPITVKPSGKSGTRVSGTLYVDDANFILFHTLQAPNGNEVAAIHYSYTIK